MAWTIARFASQDEEAQSELASQGAIRLLVALLAHDTIEDTATNKLANKAISIHSIVKTNMVQLKGAELRSRSQSGLRDSGQETDLLHFPNTAMAPKPGSTLNHLRSSVHAQVSPENSFPGSRHTSSLRQSSRTHRDREDPEIKLGLKAQAAHALWKLAAGNIKNSKLITDTRALLCFAKLIETENGDVKFNSVMAVMEIAAAAERDPELRRAAFKTNSPAAKAVIERLLVVIRDEDENTDLQVCKKLEKPELLVLFVLRLAYMRAQFPFLFYKLCLDQIHLQHLQISRGCLAHAVHNEAADLTLLSLG